MGDNIKMDLKEIGCEGIGWIHAHDRFQWPVIVNMIINLRVP
jgi:hypothetical protein